MSETGNAESVLKKIEERCETYAQEIADLASTEPKAPKELSNRDTVKDILAAAVIYPPNCKFITLDRAVGLFDGTVQRWLEQGEEGKTQSCSKFREKFLAVRYRADAEIQKGIVKEAIDNPKFGLDYKKATEPADFGKQIVEKNENKTLNVNVNQELERLAKALGPEAMMELVKLSDGSYSAIVPGREGTSLPSPAREGTVPPGE